MSVLTRSFAEKVNVCVREVIEIALAYEHRDLYPDVVSYGSGQRIRNVTTDLENVYKRCEPTVKEIKEEINELAAYDQMLINAAIVSSFEEGRAEIEKMELEEIGKVQCLVILSKLRHILDIDHPYKAKGQGLINRGAR